ncbi:MAG: molybdenum cofactor biosynthesis protein MoaE [Ferrimicrobium sp.]
MITSERVIDECIWVALSDSALSLDEVYQFAQRPDAGAVVVFSGTVRSFAEGREGVTYLDYEVYEALAINRFVEIAETARAEFADVRGVALHHRTGSVALGQPSVLIACSAAHRPSAFEAARYIIDTVKVAAPIWKYEHWDTGNEWSPVSHQLESVPPRTKKGANHG